MNWKTRILEAFTPDVPDDDVLEELAQHASATYAAARAEQCGTDEAERRVNEQIRAWVTDPGVRTRRPRRAPAVEPPPGSARRIASVVQDTRYAWRLLRRQPAYAALVVATMALGIAATTVLGAVAYGVLLKPLPWADAPRLVRLYETRQGSTKRFSPMMTNGTYLAWRKSARTLDAMGAWKTDEVVLADRPGAARITIGRVTPSLFPMLQVSPALGRRFGPQDASPGQPPIVILSYGLWQQQFGGRPDAIGSPIRFDKKTYTIVGVMPASFAFPNRDTRAWVPFAVPPELLQSGPNVGIHVSMLQALGRLKPGVTPAQAAAEGTTLARAAVPNAGVASTIAIGIFGSDEPIEITTIPLLRALTAEVRPAILILLAAVAILLATATANVASLQLARATSRRRELAVRSALGADRGRLVRQTLVENVLLGLLGGAAGLALAAGLQRALPSILPAHFPRIEDIALGWRIQALAVAISILAGVGSGLLPAWHIARGDLVPALAEDSLAPAGGGLRTRTGRARAVIMAAQVAMACVLLISALLLTRSFLDLMNANVGYDSSNLLTARLFLPATAFTPERRLDVLDQVMRRISSVGHVTHAAYSNTMPFGKWNDLTMFWLKRHDGSTVEVQTGLEQVSPDFFAALDQRIVEGRGFTAADESSGQAVLVNEAFSRRYLDGRALGRTLTLPGDGTSKTTPPPPRSIVGIVDDTVRNSVTDTPQPEIYYTPSNANAGGPARHVSDDDIFLIVRTSSDPETLVPTLRDIVRTAAPTAPLEQVMTMRERVADSLANPRLYAALLGAFALFALLIAGVGLFGVLSYSVAQRAREIGIRSALVAQIRDIVALVVRQSMAIAIAGLAIGIVASYWVSRLLGTFLYGVTPHDAISYAAVALVLLAVSALASVVPARRAAKVDPVKVLRA
ncbi:MAG: ABC transporter permease [Vicinamibacterales bacterium]